jgi:hypothetical protein
MDVTGNRQILRGTGATISVTVTDSDVTLFGSATLVVTAYDGTVVVPSTAATGTGGSYTYRLPATATANLDILTAAWTVIADGVAETVTTTVEVVGGYLFSIAEARVFDQKQLANTTAFPDAAIIAARANILDAFQDICNVGFVPRYTESFLSGYSEWHLRNHSDLFLPYPLPRALRGIAFSYWSGAWVEYDITTLGPVELTPEGLLRGQLYTPYGEFGTMVRVRYEHGMDGPPAAIKKAALQILLYELIPSNLPDRATSQVIGDTTYRLTTADAKQRYYGIPSVDAILARYAYSTIG